MKPNKAQVSPRCRRRIFIRTAFPGNAKWFPPYMTPRVKSSPPFSARVIFISPFSSESRGCYCCRLPRDLLKGVDGVQVILIFLSWTVPWSNPPARSLFVVNEVFFFFFPSLLSEREQPADASASDTDAAEEERRNKRDESAFLFFFNLCVF